MEQSPIDLTEKNTEDSAKMQLNGFGYKNMATANVFRNANTIFTNLTDGEL
jgi:carbonic anhydrase